jgi:Penicillinase repressor
VLPWFATCATIYRSYIPLEVERLPRSTFQLFGPTELETMHILWERGRGPVRDVTEAICERRPIAHNTMLTVLGRLADKGILTEEELLARRVRDARRPSADASREAALATLGNKRHIVHR